MLVSSCCFAIIVFILARVAILKRDLFSPVPFFFLSEYTTLGIAYLKFNVNMTDFHLKTWIVLIGAGLCFFCGGLISKIHLEAQYGRFNSQKINIEFLRENLKNYNWNLHIALSFLAFFGCAVLYANMYRDFGGVPIVLKHGAKIMGIEGVNYGFFQILVVSGPLPVFMFLLSSFKSINPNYFLCLLSKFMVGFTIILSTSFFMSRGNLSNIIIFWMVLFYYLYKPISIKTLVLFPILAFLIFTGIGLSRSQFNGENPFKNYLIFLKLPYNYIANDYWNLDYALNPPIDLEIHPFRWGYGFIEAWFSHLSVGRFAEPIRVSFQFDTIFNKSIQKVEGLNTVTFHWPLYVDFWYFGVFGIPFLFGLAMFYLYWRVKVRPSLRNLSIFASLMFMIGMSHHDEFYQIPTYSFWPAYLFIAISLCYSKPKLISEKEDV